MVVQSPRPRGPSTQTYRYNNMVLTASAPQSASMSSR